MLLCIHVANFALAVARRSHASLDGAQDDGAWILADKADR